MAHLMVIPIQDRGEAVLIVTRDGDATLMGFVAVTTLCARTKSPLSPDECLKLVERNLPAFEKILIRKSSEAAFVDASIACVEIDAIDLTKIGIAE